MATVKIYDLHSPLPASMGDEEFIGAVSSAVIRALDARQQQNIRGGLQSSVTAGIWLAVTV